MESALIPTRSLQKLHRHVGLLPYLKHFAIRLQETHFQMHFKFYVCCRKVLIKNTLQRISGFKGSCIWKDVSIWNSNVLGSHPAHAVFTLKRLHGQRSLALLWSQETRLQKPRLHLCGAKPALTYMNNRAMNNSYKMPIYALPNCLDEQQSVWESLVSRHCMSAKNKKKKDKREVLTLSFLCRITSPDKKLPKKILHRHLNSI